MTTYGYCLCGCGLSTKLATKNDVREGWVKGEPKRFLRGHNNAKTRLAVTQPDDPTIKIIPLTKDRQTIVDTDDYHRLGNLKWQAYWAKSTLSFYALRALTSGGSIPITHAILGTPPEGMVIDHINGDTLDNRKANLRFATRGQNCINAKIQSNNTSGRTGLRWIESSKKYQVRLAIDGVSINLGLHADYDKACSIREAAERIYFGEYKSDRTAR